MGSLSRLVPPSPRPLPSRPELARNGRPPAILPARPPKAFPSLLHYTPLPILPVSSGDLVVINHGASGIGDGLLGLCAVSGLRHELGQRVFYRCGPAALPFVRMFDGWDEISTHDSDTQTGPIKDVPAAARAGDRQLNQGYTFELGTQAREPRLNRYCRNIGCSSPALPELRERGNLALLGRRYAGAIALCPCSRSDGRSYPLRSWQTLARALQAQGRKVLVVGDDQGQMVDIAGEQLLSCEPAHVVACLANCGCVVACDSGMGHLAAICATPTVILASVTRADRIFDFYPHALWLRGALDCWGCHWQSPFRQADCVPRCPDLASVEPARVIAAIEVAERCRALDANNLTGWKGNLLHRCNTFTPFIRHILTTARPMIVETGTQRARPDPGAGESTRLLACAALAARGNLISIDTNAESVAMGKSVTIDLPAICEQKSGENYLASYQGRKIDALYLDSADCGSDKYTEHCLREAKAAVAHVAAGGMLLIDDTVRDGETWSGKGQLAVPYLLQLGWSLVGNGYQVLLRKVS